MNKLRKLSSLHKHPAAKTLGIYTFTKFFAKGSSFLLLFIYTNPLYITPAENGLLSLMSTSIIFLVPFVFLGSVHSINADFFKLSAADFRDTFTTSFIMPVIITALSFAGLFIFKDELNAAYGLPFSFVWIIPTIVFCNFVYDHLVNLIRNNNEPKRFLKVNIVRTLVEMILSVVLVVYFAWRWEGRVAGILLSYGYCVAYAVYYFNSKGYLFGKIKSAVIKNELVYALPVILMQISIFSMSSSDKFFLSAFTNDNNETVGIYSIACVFASVITILCSGVLHYFYPKIFTNLSRRETDFKSIRKSFYLYAAIMFGCLVIIMLAAPVLYHYFINEKYHSALDYLVWLGLGYFLWSVSYFFYSSMLFYKEKKKLLVLSLLSIIISLALNYFFIAEWGVRGAAWSVFAGYFIVLILTVLINWSFIKPVFFTAQDQSNLKDEGNHL